MDSVPLLDSEAEDAQAGASLRVGFITCSSCSYVLFCLVRFCFVLFFEFGRCLYTLTRRDIFYTPASLMSLLFLSLLRKFWYCITQKCYIKFVFSVPCNELKGQGLPLEA